MTYYHFKKHDPRATCQICGFDFNRSALRKNWRGLWVCPQDWEPRNEADFVRGVKDKQQIRGGAVPPAADIFSDNIPYNFAPGIIILDSKPVLFSSASIVD